MKVEQCRWNTVNGWEALTPTQLGTVAQLVLVFGDTAVLQQQEPLSHLRQLYPAAHFLGCSTAGEIYDTQVTDASLVATAIYFECTQLQGHAIHLEADEASFAAGQRLGQLFAPDGLVHVFVLSDGLQVNGSELVKGLTQALPTSVTLTGGLSGDGARFQQTLVLWDGAPQPGLIAAIGLYSDRLTVGYASLGGWTPFGPKRIVTRSHGNVLYELDGHSALTLYKKYLGEHADGLPATGLLFPLCLYNNNTSNTDPADNPHEQWVVRTILAVDETEQSLTFAGDIPEGATVQLMQGSFDRLVDGAIAAATTSCVATPAPDLAILISCVGRKLLLKQRIEEEVEGVREVMGQTTVLTGFYSYGEIAPTRLGIPCELHNQTMTITTFNEGVNQ